MLLLAQLHHVKVVILGGGCTGNMGTVTLAVPIEEVRKWQQLDMGHNVEIALSRVDAGINDIDRYVGDRTLTISRLCGAEIGVDAVNTPRKLLCLRLHPTVRFDVGHPWMLSEEVNLLGGQAGSKPTSAAL